jgi:serine/threonine-protein kinase HSL1 (negative regulator of Swe1 kinase)
MFYNALIKFRNEQLENYQGQPLEYSASDYHHISRLPAAVANRRKHARMPAGSRRLGQNSTTATSSSKQPQSTPVALKSSATEKSYDPFRSPRHIVATPEVQYAQVTIHRNDPEANTKDVSEAVPELDAMKEEEVEDIECLPSSPFSIVPNKKSKASFTRSFQSRASHSSARRVTNTTPTPRSASYKRNVLFQHRNRSQGSMSARPKKTRTNASNISRQESECSIKSDVDGAPFSDRCGSPLLPVPPIVVRGAGVTIRNCPQVKRVCDADIIWKDEARKVSHELSQICEEAFNGGSLSTGCTASIGSQTPATSLSIASAGDSQNQITGSNIKSTQPSNVPGESPKTYTATELAETRRKLIQHSTQDGTENVPGYLSAVINHLDRLIAQDRTRERGKRDKINDNGISAYDPRQWPSLETGNLPIISEELSNSLASENEMRNGQHVTRHNSDSASSIRTKRQSRDGKATIRMVPHSSQRCLEEIKPLNIRKNRQASKEPHPPREESLPKDENSRPIRSSQRYSSADSRQTRFLSELDPIQEVPKVAGRSDTKTSENKKWSWFRNRSQGSTETKVKTPVVKPIQPSGATVIVHEIDPPVDPAPSEQTEKPKDMKGPSDNKKGGFFKKFMKKRHSDSFDNVATGRLSILGHQQFSS